MDHDPNYRDDNFLPEEVGIEVVGIRRSKSKPSQSITASTTAKLQKLAQQRRKRAQRLSLSEKNFLVPSIDTCQGNAVEIAMQGIPKAPSAMPSRAPHVKHVPGTLLQPPQPLSSDDDHLYDDELIAAPPIPITAHQNKNNKRGHVPQSTDRSSSKLRQPSPIQAIHSLPIMRPVSQRPSRETFGVTETAEVLHVHGDPFPPCFRVVGVSQESVETTRISPTNIHNDSMGGYNTSQLHLLHDTQSGDRGLNASNTRSSESSQPAPSDKKGDDDENVANTKTRKSYLQMSFGWAYPRRPAESTREIFEDEEEAVQVDTSEDKDSEPETSLSIAESQMSTTQSYLALTKQLMQQRKARERRQLEKQQQQQKQQPT